MFVKDTKIPTSEQVKHELEKASFEKKYLTVRDCIELHDQAPDSLWFYLPQNNVSMLYGPPDEAKSFLAIGLAIAVAEGRPSYLEWDINARFNRIIYLGYLVWRQ